MAAQDKTAAPWRIDGGKEEEENRSERQEAADRRWGDGEAKARAVKASSGGKRAQGRSELLGGDEHREACSRRRAWLLWLAYWCWHQQHDAGGVLLLLCGLALLVGYRCRWNAPQSHTTPSV
ncbi:hypothetical protein PHYSODRAFT_286151 [Phytophthora sojae]|uniref:Uncharacterized protein n=1 Tax=Phytophthora sojae (strain P6497) TaxID=1094619 RepID=G4ZNI3_PHYSP|nr:hypothetical protein PHYSODRAFT_286151 [Phytophthora sojae]EGZ14391.1 hypothetical protein PHYSODRAFT_286151 [Phytophthora sojae]|eukprot:XP_009528140.1 hypothetical protein PHYSODRAFT_286151 [Phytophthora sojae]